MTLHSSFFALRHLFSDLSGLRVSWLLVPSLPLPLLHLPSSRVALFSVSLFSNPTYSRSDDCTRSSPHSLVLLLPPRRSAHGGKLLALLLHVDVHERNDLRVRLDE